MIREDLVRDCIDCQPWCDERCRGMGPFPPRFSLAGGSVDASEPPRLLFAPFDGTGFIDADRVITDDDYTRGKLASGDKLLASYGNWNLVFKARPYGVKDFMIMIDLTGGSPVVGIEDLSDEDLIDLLALIEHLRGEFEVKYPESKFIFGLNKGKNQSLKRIHLHVTDVNEAIEPSEDKVCAHVRARVSSTRRPYKVTREVAQIVQRVVPQASLDNSTIKVPLYGDDTKDIVMLKTLGERFSEVLVHLDGEGGAREQWCYSMLFEEDDDGEFIRVAFFDRPVGTTDVAGVGLDWYEGTPGRDFLDERRILREYVQMMVDELTEE